MQGEHWVGLKAGTELAEASELQRKTWGLYAKTWVLWVK